MTVAIVRHCATIYPARAAPTWGSVHRNCDSRRRCADSVAAAVLRYIKRIVGLMQRIVGIKAESDRHIENADTRGDGYFLTRVARGFGADAQTQALGHFQQSRGRQSRQCDHEFLATEAPNQ